MGLSLAERLLGPGRPVHPEFLAHKKLNLASSTRCLNGWLNIDWPPQMYEGFTENKALSEKWTLRRPDAYCDINRLPFPNGHFESVRASHALEHFPQVKTLTVLKEWARVLKTGGTFDIVVPDLEFIMRKYFDEPEDSKWWQVQMNDPGLFWDGETKKPYATKDAAMAAMLWLNGHHTAGFTGKHLEWCMNYVGIKDVQRYPHTDELDTSIVDYSLRMRGIKL